AHDAVLRREVDVQVVDLEELLGHRRYVGRMRGSRTAYARSTTALKNTMKNAPKSVTPMIGGRSKFAIDCAAYCPTPCKSKTVSVRIAPPPSTAAKSRPKSVTIGISELRSTCFAITRRGPTPFARAVRT